MGRTKRSATSLIGPIGVDAHSQPYEVFFLKGQQSSSELIKAQRRKVLVNFVFLEQKVKGAFRTNV